MTRLDFTRMGSHSVGFHAPVALQPQTWPIRNMVVCKPRWEALRSSYGSVSAQSISTVYYAALTRSAICFDAPYPLPNASDGSTSGSSGIGPFKTSQPCTAAIEEVNNSRG